jgi:hypothetical protein
VHSTGEEFALFPRFCLKKDQLKVESIKLKRGWVLMPIEWLFPTLYWGAALAVSGRIFLESRFATFNFLLI